MRHFLLACTLCAVPFASQAQTEIESITNGHILPRFEALVQSARAFADVAVGDCAPTSPALRAAYGTAFDAWVAASHLRFGPTEVDDRAFALAFWPDSRGATPRALAGLIADEDPIAANAASYADMSIAARGFYAMEFLLFDDALSTAGDADYHCKLVQTVAADIAATSEAILDDWQGGYADVVQSPGPDSVYRSEEEVLQEMLRALSTGLELTSDVRLGRPLGTFDAPRPKRAEAYRSGRSEENVVLSLTSLRDLAARMSADDAALADKLDAEFGTVLERLDTLDDPVFAGVSEPQSRLRIEVVQQGVDAIRNTVTQELGPTLGVAAGFNSLDGD
ncbi:imelysin family protein [Sulfitobacter sp.]|uniref:imelysin family protein n=1 Tax=Sulfitobacter sp. TaxID=1903071 RepID=UPI003299E943